MHLSGRFNNTFLALLISILISTAQGENLSETELRRSLPADTLLEFLEDSEGTFPKLTQLAVRAEPLGAILLLTDTLSQQQWLDQSQHLRIYLAEQGWLTLTLPLPIQPVRTDRDTDDSFAERLDQHASRVTSRIESGLSSITEERILIIAFGRSVEWAIRSLQNHNLQSNDPGIRLIMINPRPANDQNPLSLLEAMAEIESTVIDLYKEPYPADQKAIPDARMRRNTMVRAGHPDFHQQVIKDAIWGRESDWLKRQVRGLINTHIILADKRREAMTPEAMEVDERPPGIRR